MFDHFCKYVFTCVNIFFGGGVRDFFHQGNKLVSNQKFFCVFCVFCSWAIKELFCH